MPTILALAGGAGLTYLGSLGLKALDEIMLHPVKSGVKTMYGENKTPPTDLRTALVHNTSGGDVLGGAPQGSPLGVPQSAGVLGASPLHQGPYGPMGAGGGVQTAQSTDPQQAADPQAAAQPQGGGETAQDWGNAFQNVADGIASIIAKDNNYRGRVLEGMASRRGQLEAESERKYQMKRQDLKDALDPLTTISTMLNDHPEAAQAFLPGGALDGHLQQSFAIARATLIRNGYKPEEADQAIEQYHTVINAQIQAAQIPKQGEAFTLSPDQTRYNAAGEPIASGVPKPPDYNKPFLPDGSPNVAYQEYEKAKAKAGATNVSNVVTGGTTTLTPAAATGVENKVIDATDELAQINTIEQGFKPEYQQYQTTTGMAWAALKDKFGTLPDEEKAKLADYTTYKANAAAHLNEQLHRMSGAAISPSEAERLMAGLPNAGTGMFDGDSPVEFQAKLESTAKNIRMAVARYKYYLAKGIPNQYATTDLDQVPKLIDDNGALIEKQVRASNPGMDDAAVHAEVVAQLKSLFGI